MTLFMIPFRKKQIRKSKEITKEEAEKLRNAEETEKRLRAEHRQKVDEELKRKRIEFSKLYDAKIAEIKSLRERAQEYRRLIDASTIVAQCYKNSDCIASVISSIERYPEYTLTDALKDYDKYKADLIRMQYESQRRFEKEQELKEELNKIATDFNNSLDRIRDAENQRTQAIQDELYKLRKELNDN
ncbi:MAG: hypothetical protein IKB23_00720, partial [Clostridia bacterium]|nr:hypothetical protein [Clostridia bacterium]